MTSLDFHQYGKTQIRLTQIQRSSGRHEVFEASIKILFRGDFSDSYASANNSKVLPTDTMKNTVYALARQQPIESVEGFARNLARCFINGVSHPEEVHVEIEQEPWTHIDDHSSAFVIRGRERRVAIVSATRECEQVTSGIRGLELLKTADSAFAGFVKDGLTTLTETRDRLLGTVLDADWTYRHNEIEFNREHEHLLLVLLDTFANHVSHSVQHTLYDMAVAALRSSAALAEIHLVMPNKHRLLVDLAKFGMDNPNQIFVPTDEPSGYVEARVSANHQR